MIESIYLCNAGAYDAVGTKIEKLNKLNFSFGANGSGKTTISRVIEDSRVFPSCQVIWTGSHPLETSVYNKDFVDKHFDSGSIIKGIYTFGENIDLTEKIKTLKSEADAINAKLGNLRKTLSGEDGNSGKKKEREALETQFLQDVWSAKLKFSDLKDAFTGLNNDKKKFRDRYLIEASSNEATVRDISELREDATTVFSGSLTKVTILPSQDISNILALESSYILNKRLIGKEDIDISALIEKVGNIDWVQQEKKYFDQLEDQCPFCQQKTDATFRHCLEAYFDESYIADLAAIDKLITEYSNATKDLLTAFSAADISESPYLDRKAFDRDVAALRQVLHSNVEHITAKRKEPSTIATLTDTAPLLAAANAHIVAANKVAIANNDTIDNLASRKKELTSQIWKRLLDDTKTIYNKFKSETSGLDAAITSLEDKIEKETINPESNKNRRS